LLSKTDVERALDPDASGRPGPTVAAVLATGAIIAVAFMGSVIVTPLYSVYQVKFGFSEITLTLIYAVYVVGNVAALLLFGQISDQVGRKRVTLPALAVAAASAVMFLLANGTAWLYAGRLLIGLAVGVLSGTGTAWLAEHFGPSRRPLATVTAATANLIGIALGPLVGGLLAQYGPARLVLPFVVYLALIALVAAAIVRTPEPGPLRARRWREIRVQPRIGVPRERLHAFAAPAVTGFVTFALGGLYFALVPGIVLRDLHEKNLAIGGLVVFELGAIAAICIVLGRRIPPSTAMISGLVSLLPAVSLVVLAQAVRSMPLLLIATAFAGVTMATGYRGSLEVVNQIAPDDRRAEVVSTYLIACFVGNSLPVIGLGVLSTLTDPLLASVVFAATIGVLALGAIAWYRRRGILDDR
jgi:predicted MFS family arabinose efflux permease